MSSKHLITDANVEAFNKKFRMTLALSSGTAVEIECPYCAQKFHLPVNTQKLCPACQKITLLLIASEVPAK